MQPYIKELDKKEKKKLVSLLYVCIKIKTFFVVIIIIISHSCN